MVIRNKSWEADICETARLKMRFEGRLRCSKKKRFSGVVK